MRSISALVAVLLIFSTSAGCTLQPVTTKPPSGDAPSLAISTKPLFAPSPCEGRFVIHELEHITTIRGDEVRMFDSNGAGLAINDLDNDGDLDVVLANLAEKNAIFWNEGALLFRKEEFPHGQTRAVNVVDINGDGWQDIVFARRTLRPSIWVNSGAGPDGRVTFTRQNEVDIAQRVYTMAWADLDGDVDLDAVVATYQTETQQADAADMAGGGVVYYENVRGRLVPHELAFKSQALALLLTDLNQDGRLDIWVGHDFLLPDQVWLRHNDGWQEVQLFAAMTQNTMSFDAGDVNNDGRFDLFAADMMPFADDATTRAAWQPLMDSMHDMDIPDDAQVMENVLHLAARNGEYQNQADGAGLRASGWSWSAKFGDLDNDGFLDLYVVNGMAAAEMFSHLPGNELVEENLAFRNLGDGTFAHAPEWGLGSTAGGRSMSMADLDSDGDLDIVVNNLLAPAQLFENRLCGDDGLAVDLFWPASQNSRAIGARLVLHTSAGKYTRSIRSASGYLSGDPARVHFGLPTPAVIERLDIVWPDGERSTVDSVEAKSHLEIVRTN